MSTRPHSAKLSALLFSLFIFSFFFLFLDSTFQIKNRLIVFTQQLNVVISSDPQRETRSFEPRNKSWAVDLIEDLFKGKDINIGLVNIHEGKEEWGSLGKTSELHFNRVPESLKWTDIIRTDIDEQNMGKTKCPEIPMPNFQEYDEFDVIVSRVPCGNGKEKEGIRDVFRLQVNLVVANVVVRNSYEKKPERPVYVVFIGSCGPMWEIFRCDDLLEHQGDVWIYKPDLKRLKQKVLLPVGTCQLSVPYTKLENGDVYYNFSTLYSPIDHPREAYATVLHSTEAYVCGAIVLAQSILRTNTTKDLVLLADASLSLESRQALETAGWKIKLIERIESPFALKDAYNKWNYSKLRLWQLTGYHKVMFIDSDLVVLRNLDNFFKLPQLSAVRNSRIIFNSGLMLIEPSDCVFETLMMKRHTLFSYNGGDQGYLNEAFTWWHRLPRNLNYHKYVKENSLIKLEFPKWLYAAHFLGIKPWMCYRDYDCNWDSKGYEKFASDLFHQKWWGIHDTMPKKLHRYCDLSKSMNLQLKEMRKEARKGNFSDGHWKIKVKDPRQHCPSCG